MFHSLPLKSVRVFPLLDPRTGLWATIYLSLQNKWFVEVYSKGQVTDTGTPEKSTFHQLTELPVMSSTAENYQKFAH